MGVKNTYYIIFVLGLVLFLAPMEQASAVFFLPPEWTEEELLELFKQKQLLRAELQNEENFDFESYKQEQLCNKYFSHPCPIHYYGTKLLKDDQKV